MIRFIAFVAAVVMAAPVMAQVTITPATFGPGSTIALGAGTVAVPSLQIGSNAGIFNDLGGYIMFSSNGNNPVSIASDYLTMKGTASISWANNVTWSGHDIQLWRDDTGILAQRNGTGAAPQAYRLYNTYTNASNREYGYARWVSNRFELGMAEDGTGSPRDFAIVTDNSTGSEAIPLVFSVSDNSLHLGFSNVNTVKSTVGWGSTSTTGTLVTNDAQTVANAAVISLGANTVNAVYMISASNGTNAIFTVNGASQVTELVFSYGAGTYYSITKNTASKVNVYWETDAYKLQNLTGSSMTIRLIRLGI